MLFIRCMKCGDLILKRRGIGAFCQLQCKIDFENKFKMKVKEMYGYIYKISNLNGGNRIVKTTENNKSIQNSTNKRITKDFKITILDSAINMKDLNKKLKYWKEFYNQNNPNV